MKNPLTATLKGRLIITTLALVLITLVVSTYGVSYYVKNEMEKVLLGKSVETAADNSTRTRLTNA